MMSVVWFTYWTLVLFGVITRIKTEKYWVDLTKGDSSIFSVVNPRSNSVRQSTLFSAR